MPFNADDWIVPITQTAGIPPAPDRLVAGFPQHGRQNRTDKTRESPGGGSSGSTSADRGLPTGRAEELSASPEAARIAHSLAHAQEEISHTLEMSLRNLQQFVVQAETLSEKIRSTLRRTEPTREHDHGADSGYPDL